MASGLEQESVVSTVEVVLALLGHLKPLPTVLLIRDLRVVTAYKAEAGIPTNLLCPCAKATVGFQTPTPTPTNMVEVEYGVVVVVGWP
jgi:hypothetical protein